MRAVDGCGAWLRRMVAAHEGLDSSHAEAPMQAAIAGRGWTLLAWAGGHAARTHSGGPRRIRARAQAPPAAAAPGTGCT
jgi:hypothetical protein